MGAMGERILLAVDYDTAIRVWLRTLLERSGFNVSDSSTAGWNVVTLAAKEHPDMAVLDLASPPLDGIDIVRRIRKVSPRTRVVLLTMYSQGRAVMDSVRSGVCAVVLKSGLEQFLRRFSGK